MSRRLKRNSKLMQQVLRVLPNECFVCGEVDGLELDHIHPISQGGSDTIENCQLLCSACHRQKTNVQRRQRMTRVTADGRVIAGNFPIPKPKAKLAGSRSRYSGRQNGW